MPDDKRIISTQILEDTADAIREKLGTQAGITPAEFASKISEISPAPDLQSKTIDPTTSQQVVSADSGYYGLSTVTVNAVDNTIDSNIQAGNIKKDVEILGVTGSYEGSGSEGLFTIKPQYTKVTRKTTALSYDYDFNGSWVWTDGTDIYCTNFTLSGYEVDLKFDKNTKTWIWQSWSSSADYGIDGSKVWTDGEHICYDGLLIWNKTTKEWEAAPWTGLLSSASGNKFWSDGDNIYYSLNNTLGYNLMLDKTNLSWSKVNFSGMVSFDGSNIWTDGENIYYSAASIQKKLNKATRSWSDKNWTGLSTALVADRIWSDGKNTYFSVNSTEQYILNKIDNSWDRVTFTGSQNFNGRGIWTDGENIYFASYTPGGSLDPVYLKIEITEEKTAFPTASTKTYLK